MKKNKLNVHEFWNKSSCGEDLYLKGSTQKESFINQSITRYILEPYILNFAGFNNYKNKKVLEIGLGLGADHQKFAESGANLYGVDLTEKSIMNVRDRLKVFNLKSKISLGDAEKLIFEDDFFDLVYSWGVIHHSPQTEDAVDEIYRVLKKGSEAKIMIYNKYSLVGFMLWIRYSLLKCNFSITLDEIYSKYLESPGTKAYTKNQAFELFKKFKEVKIKTVLTHADLLSSKAGQRHEGFILSIARKLYPRFIFKIFFKKFGLFMMINVIK
mgnify:CR=1 FL=1|tara:strand:- start:1557 stop:2366 length:810 start_codon:yes stop_codon:yes gene_type:complete